MPELDYVSHPSKAGPRWGKRSVAECAVLSLSGLMVALAASWLLLAAFSFNYAFWHDYGGIGEAIERYAPENRFKNDFHLTTPEQRFELFAGITKAIHQQGQGLDSLFYKVDGQPLQQLLRTPEIVHLQDVARLVDVGLGAAAWGLFIWLGAWLYFATSKRPIPPFKWQVAILAAISFVIAVVIVIAGAKEVFYALHHWIFPAGNPWFFYYQDSLMSTMMYAPVLFGWIALEWALIAVLMFMGFQYCGGVLIKRYQR